MGFGVFDWVDFHALYGINPRCIDQFGGRCYKLDTTNMPWPATLAVWLDQGFAYLVSAFSILGAIVAVVGALLGLLLILRSATTARSRRDVLSRFLAGRPTLSGCLPGYFFAALGSEGLGPRPPAALS